MKLMRILFASLLLLPAAAFAQEGVATFKYTMQGRGGAPEGQSRVYYSPSAFRVEMEMSLKDSAPTSRPRPAGAPTSFKTTMLTKVSEPGKVYTINDERRTYSVTDVSKTHDTDPKNDEKYTVKRQGSDRVAGISCEKVLVTSSKGTEVELCVATDIAMPSGWSSAMNRQNVQHGAWMKAVQDAGLKGFPIRTKFRSGSGENGTEILMELVSLEKKSVPAAMFQVPAGYKEASASTVNMTPAQEKQMQDALSKLTPEQRKAYEDAMKEQGKKQ